MGVVSNALRRPTNNTFPKNLISLKQQIPKRMGHSGIKQGLESSNATEDNVDSTHDKNSWQVSTHTLSTNEVNILTTKIKGSMLHKRPPPLEALQK